MTVKRQINFANQPFALTGESLNQNNARLTSMETAVITGVAGPSGPEGTPGSIYYCQLSMSTDFSTYTVGQSASLTLPPTPGLQFSANQTLILNCIDVGQTDYYVICLVSSFVDNVLIFEIITIHLPTQEGQTSVGTLWEINMTGARGPPGSGSSGPGYIEFPISVTNNFTDCITQLVSGGSTGPNSEKYSACRFAVDAQTPVQDINSKTLSLPTTFSDGTHLVINQETEGIGTFLLTVQCTNEDSSLYSIQMISEPISFRKEQGTWSSYSGF